MSCADRFRLPAVFAALDSYVVADHSVRRRRSAKVLLVDPSDRVLLFRGGDPHRPDAGTWWFPPGGGVEAAETVEDAARREVLEETGQHVDELGQVILSRVVEFEVEGIPYRQHEIYFLVRVGHFTVSEALWTANERRVVHEHRWWTREALCATSDVIYPEGICDLLPVTSA